MVPPDPHQEFRELCALSTTGELTVAEWNRLKAHLEHCATCRAVKREYEQLIATAIPSLADKDATHEAEDTFSDHWSIDQAEAQLMESLREEPSRPILQVSKPSKASWHHARRYAVAASVLMACGFAGYLIGIRQEHRTIPDIVSSSAPVKAVPSQLPQPSAQADTPNARVVKEDPRISELREQLQQAQSELAGVKSSQAELQGALAARSEALDHSVQDRADLEKRLADAQSNAQSLQARLNLVGYTTSQDATQAATLRSQVSELSAALDEKNKEIGREQELLQHDRDIRNLISARNLYIAEIYDIAKTGDTQKPFGRIFYTKGKSLVFYGYDLDQQHGVKQTSTFQAWGRQGADQKHAVSLGLLYQDDSAQKRWVLKNNDAKAIASIDAVFVTVEPQGGSSKPTGKPLLFTYLRLDPNHP